MKLALPPAPETDVGRSQKNRIPIFLASLRAKAGPFLCPQRGSWGQTEVLSFFQDIHPKSSLRWADAFTLGRGRLETPSQHLP